MRFRRALVATALAMLAFAACGSPTRVRTAGDEPDLARDASTISDRLHKECAALDVANATPKFVDNQCEWLDSPNGLPQLFVGILASSEGGTALDQTKKVLLPERRVEGVGSPAVFDPETRTLYVLEHGRLWYLQRVGPGGDDVGFLSRLGTSLSGRQAA